jgi:bud emergence protein 1
MAQSFSKMPLMSSTKHTDFLRAIKALRRSIKGEEKAKAHVSIGPKSAVAIVPPKKVRLL